jgi:hypothetical protein
MRKPYAPFLEQLKASLLDKGCVLPVEVRTDIIAGRILEGALNAFVVRVRGNASSITQQHIDELKAGGLTEDEIFEATLCAAFLAGHERYQAAMKAMGEQTDAA